MEWNTTTDPLLEETFGGKRAPSLVSYSLGQRMCEEKFGIWVMEVGRRHFWDLYLVLMPVDSTEDIYGY